MRQTWRDLIWCHWPVAPSDVAAVLPPGLEPDLFDGSAWVGLVPFSMTDLRLAGPFGSLSKVFGVRNFGEVNVRTYVRGPKGRTGVWFCTLDADSWLAVATAKITFGLPYRRATTHFQRVDAQWRWRSERSHDRACAELEVDVVDDVARPAREGLEQFLFERYALYTTKFGRLWRGELRHEPWRVRDARLRRVRLDTIEAAGFRSLGDAHVRVGEPVSVSVFRLRQVGRTPRTLFGARVPTPHQ